MSSLTKYSIFEQSLLDSCSLVSVDKATAIIKVTGSITLSPQISGFKGHFPEEAIFPAVMQLTMVRLLCSEACGLALENQSIGRTKFSWIIRPNEVIQVEIELSENAGSYRAQFRFINNSHQASSGTAIYRVHHRETGNN